MNPHAARPDELLSLSALKAFAQTPVNSAHGAASNYYTQVNELMNGLGTLPVMRRTDAQEAGEDSYYGMLTAALKKQFLPEYQSYEGLEQLNDLCLLLRDRLASIDGAIKRPEEKYSLPTKNSMHRVLNDAYATLNPETNEGQHYRNILEKSAEILELPALSVSPSADLGVGGEVSEKNPRGKKR